MGPRLAGAKEDGQPGRRWSVGGERARCGAGGVAWPPSCQTPIRGMATLDGTPPLGGRAAHVLPASSLAGWAEGAQFPSFPVLLWTLYVNKDAICFKKIR